MGGAHNFYKCSDWISEIMLYYSTMKMKCDWLRALLQYAIIMRWGALLIEN